MTVQQEDSARLRDLCELGQEVRIEKSVVDSHTNSKEFTRERTKFVLRMRTRMCLFLFVVAASVAFSGAEQAGSDNRLSPAEIYNQYFSWMSPAQREFKSNSPFT